VTLSELTTTPAVDWSAPFDDLVERATFATRGRTVTEADVVGFASLTGDFHPLHTDAVFAAASPFGERIAHGMLLMSFAVGLTPLDPQRVLALRGLKDVTFKRPVTVGATIRVKGSIRSLRAMTEQAGLATFAWSIVDEHDRLACRSTVEVLWAREGQEDA
jgi:3-hydroxybutyryl-CoA dehydratase